MVELHQVRHQIQVADAAVAVYVVAVEFFFLARHQIQVAEAASYLVAVEV